MLYFVCFYHRIDKMKIGMVEAVMQPAGVALAARLAVGRVFAMQILRVCTRKHHFAGARWSRQHYGVGNMTRIHYCTQLGLEGLMPRNVAEFHLCLNLREERIDGSPEVMIIYHNFNAAKNILCIILLRFNKKCLHL